MTHDAFGPRDQLLAWSRRGDAALLRTHDLAYEDGAMLSYTLLRAGHPPRTFVVSDDRSPGDGTRPQRVSPEEHARALAALAAALHAAGFASLDPETARDLAPPGPRRDTAIVTRPDGDAEVRTEGRLVARVPAGHLAPRDGLEAALSPTRALLLLFEPGPLARRLHAALRRDGGWLLRRRVYVPLSGGP